MCEAPVAENTKKKHLTKKLVVPFAELLVEAELW